MLWFCFLFSESCGKVKETVLIARLFFAWPSSVGFRDFVCQNKIK